jgi:glycosyltransferase involved in cell wall biosynthesis
MKLEVFKEVVNKNHDIEVLFVNNGSTDQSAAIFEKELAINPSYPFRIVNVEKNQGYGYGILQGLYSAKGDILSWTHADMQTDPLDLIKALDIYVKLPKTQVALIKGSRRKRPLFDAIFTQGMSFFILFALKVYLKDINAQPKLFSSDFFNQIAKEAPYDFSLDLYFLYHAKKQGQILDFPVYYKNRLSGEAKGGGGSLSLKIKLVKRTIKFVLEFRQSIN